MALAFPTGASAALKASSILITAFPFTVGFWAQPNPSGTGGAWALFNQVGATTDLFHIRVANGLGAWDLVCEDAAATTDTNSTGVPVVGAWSLILLRAISATNRQFAVLNPDGSVTTVSGTTNVPTDLTVMDNHVFGNASGSFIFDGGSIAEFWYTLTDVQPDGLATQDSLMRSLAYGGPFSIPSIGPSVVQYRSFRENPFDTAVESDERFDAPIAQGVTWDTAPGFGTNIAGPHPPLPYWYKRPTEDIAAIAMI